MSTQPERDRDVARQAAIRSLVTNVISIAVMVGFTVAIAKRDLAVRTAIRVRQVVRQEWRSAAAELAVSEFRRAMSAWEHRDESTDHAGTADRGPASAGLGLYGGLASGGAAAHGDAAERPGGQQ
jgi:hypothetical protein